MKELNEEITSYSFIRNRWYNNNWLLWGDLVCIMMIINLFATLLIPGYSWIAITMDFILLPSQWVAYWIGMKKSRRILEEKREKLLEILEKMKKGAEKKSKRLKKNIDRRKKEIKMLKRK